MRDLQSFTEEAKNRLSSVLQRLEPQVDTAQAEGDLTALFDDIGYYGASKDHATARLHAVLRAYQEVLRDEHERLSEALFGLLAQLEYPQASDAEPDTPRPS